MKKEIISALAGTVIGLAGGAGIVLKTELKERIALKELSDKHLALFMMMNQWVGISTSMTEYCHCSLTTSDTPSPMTTYSPEGRLLRPIGAISRLSIPSTV